MNLGNLEGVSISALSAGDRKVYERVFEYYYKRVHHWAISIVQDSNEADDIAQDIFILLWIHRQSFVAWDKVSSWLKVCTRNAALNYNYQKKKANNQAAELARQANEEYDFEYFRSREKITLYLRAAISNLPERSQEVMRLAVKGHKNKQIAEMLSMTEKSVRNLRSRAYETIRKSMPAGLAPSIIIFFQTLEILENSTLEKNSLI